MDTYIDQQSLPPLEVTDIRSGTEAPKDLTSPYELQIHYINCLPEAVTVVDRHGIRVTYPPQRHRQYDDFVVRYTITHSRTVNVNIDRISNGGGSGSTLQQVMQEGAMIFRHGVVKRQLDFHVSARQIREAGGSLYLSNLDIVVSNLNPERGDLIPDHPMSDAGIRNTMVAQDPGINTVNSFGYSIRIIDSAGRFGERFVNINNQIFKVPVIRSSTIQDGVYLTTSGQAMGSHGYNKPECMRFSFEEAEEKLALYRSPNEARTLGNVFEAKEREYAEFKHDIKVREEELKERRIEREHEFNERKMALEQEFQERSLQLKADEQDIKRRAAELKRQQDEFEHQVKMASMDRSDRSDKLKHERSESETIIKFLPVLFTGVMALFVALQKRS